MKGLDSGDTTFMLVSAALVLLMTPGLAFFYGGLVRSRNVVNTMMMSFVAMGLIAVQWVLAGYSLAFCPRGGLFGPIVGAFDWLGLNGVGPAPNADYAPTIPHQLFMIYQAMFAVITPALISGAIVERMKFRSYMVFILLWSTLSYDLMAHWVWGVGGWLRTLGAIDFAGGTVVHINAGVAALVATLVLGKRSTFPHRVAPPHNLTLTMLGGGLLWFGWFGFNGGSALSAGAIATLAFVNTNTGAAAAMVTWVVLDLWIRGKPTAAGAITGAVAGLVAITPACGYVTPLGAIVIGAGASGGCFWAVSQRIRWKLDDTLDAFSVHGVGGIVGSLATGVFATLSVNPGGADGLLAGNPGLLGAQAVATLTTVAVSGAVTYIILKGLIAAGGIRSSDEEQHDGLDFVEHGETGYHELA